VIDIDTSPDPIEPPPPPPPQAVKISNEKAIKDQMINFVSFIVQYPLKLSYYLSIKNLISKHDMQKLCKFKQLCLACYID
jgi:hypothetical protein